MKYPVVIHKVEGSIYGVIIPNIAGCFSAGDTYKEAFRKAKKAAYEHLKLLNLKSIKD